MGVEYTEGHDPPPRVRDKVFLAIVDITESTELQLQKRLRDVYTAHLDPLSPTDFPDDLRVAFESIGDRMTNLSAIWDKGHISTPSAVLPESNAKWLIADIVSLFGNVCEALGRRG